MNTYYNNKFYASYIENKFNLSEKKFQLKFKDSDNSELFLIAYEDMNVYPTYPRPIILPLKKIKDNLSNHLNLNSNFMSFDIKPFDRLSNILMDKIRFRDSYIKEISKLANTDKIRRFFDYELRDVLQSALKTETITNAWLKMYELLDTYGIAKDITKQSFNTFHICEHPGAFIFALKYYLKVNGIGTHNFVCQSLDPKFKHAFKPNQELVSKYGKYIDYGPSNGDITKVSTLKYYRQKYKDRKFDLITSDCGQDFSSDFTKQETGLYKVFLGALINAIGLSSVGSNFVFKMFSFGDIKTVELLYIACMFYKRVDLVRTLTTKSGSGEIYVMCVDFIGIKEDDLEKLYKYLDKNEKFEGFEGFIVDGKLFDYFYKRLYNAHKILTLRRITTINQFMFRFFNSEYVKTHGEVINYVKHYVNFYTNYFYELYKIKLE